MLDPNPMSTFKIINKRNNALRISNVVYLLVLVEPRLALLLCLVFFAIGVISASAVALIFTTLRQYEVNILG